jgi:hypothetical protein
MVSLTETFADVFFLSIIIIFTTTITKFLIMDELVMSLRSHGKEIIA